MVFVNTLKSTNNSRTLSPDLSMPKSDAYLLLSFAIAIITGLSAYVTYLLYRLYRQKRPASPEIIESPAALSESQLKSWQSLNILARSVLAGQVSLTETAIRIAALLNFVAPGNSESGDFRVFFEIMEKTAHIPQFDAWIALQTSEKIAYREEMQAIELVSSRDAQIAAQRLVKLSEPYCASA